MRYIVSVYKPGYLPEAEPYHTTDLAEAIDIWRSEIAETIERISDDGAFLDAHTELHATNLDDMARRELTRYGDALYYVAGYSHKISTEED